jgi:hypothetical protein
MTFGGSMPRRKISQKAFSRRSFLKGLAASVSFYFVPTIFTKSFLSLSASAQEKRPAPPGFGGAGASSDEKSVFAAEILKRAEEVSKKWDKNSEKYNKLLTPDQKRVQRAEIEKALRGIIESKGYKIQAPTNFRIVQ